MEKFIEAVEGLVKDPEYKSEHITYVNNVESYNSECFLSIETKWFTYDIHCMKLDDCYEMHVCLSESNFSDVDDRIEASLRDGVVCESEIDIDINASQQDIRDEVMSQIDQKGDLQRFKFLRKVLDTMSRLYDQAEDLECSSLFNEMLGLEVDASF